MVVDDDPSVREALTDILSDEGFRVRDAVNGADALRQLAAARELPALLITDLAMPVMNGYELVRKFHADRHWAPVPVLVLSASADEGGLPGPVTHMSKPVESDTLVDVVRGLLRGTH